LARLLGEWKASYGIGRTITIDELIGVDHEGLKAALLVVAAMDDGLTVSNIRLARWLRKFNEVSVGHLLLRYGGVNSRCSQLWTLLADEQGGLSRTASADV
jgi:hypothetical protein